jgi:uncharacterized phage protein (TIGR01671 family)
MNIPKFRAWCPQTKRMFNVDMIHWEKDKIVTLEGFTDEGEACTIWNDEPYILQAFTGLKDKDGVEIYEGDIIEYKADVRPLFKNDQTYTSKVEFQNGMFCVTLVKKSFIPLINLFNPMSKVLVIGNIFEQLEQK